MIRMTKGERKTIRDEFKLRLNQALFQTNFHRVYGAVHERFDLETDKPTKTTLFKAHGVATVEGHPLQWFIEAAHTGDYKNQRPVFKVVTARYGNGQMGRKDLAVGGTGDLYEIGPNILREVFGAFRERLPKFLRSVEQEQQDRAAANKALRGIIETAQSSCKHKPLKYISLNLPEDTSNEVGQPYFAHMIFDYVGKPNALHFKFARIGRELEFELEYVWLDTDKTNPSVPFNVSPFTAANATLCAIRNAVSLIKIESKGNTMSATTVNTGTKQKVRAVKKPAEAKQASALPIVVEKAAVAKPAVKKVGKLNGAAAPVAQPKAAKAKPAKAELAAKPVPKRAPPRKRSKRSGHDF